MIDSPNRYLLNFGDSWAHARDAGDHGKLGYSYLMAQMMDRQWEDYSQPSTSINHMILQLRNFLHQSYDCSGSYIALFFITAQERQLLFDESGNAIEVHPSSHADYYRLYYNHLVGEFYLNTALLSLQHLCSQYHIQDYYLLGWQRPRLWQEINTDKFYDHGQSRAIDMFEPPLPTQGDLMRANHPCVVSSTNGHPSRLGHAMIAEKWHRWITSRSPAPDPRYILPVGHLTPDR